MTAHVVAATGDVPVGEGLTVDVAGLRVALFNVEGEYYAVSNRCLHKGGPMGEGYVHASLPSIDPERRTVHCPWHYWEYDLETGRRVVGGTETLRTFDVSVDGDDVVLHL